MKSIKKTIIKIKVVKRINKEVRTSYTSMVGSQILKRLKNVFDPYTSDVYDELMDEEYERAKHNFDCAKSYYGFIDKTIDDLMN